MTKDRIRELARLIPEDSQYFRETVDAVQDTTQGRTIVKDNIVIFDPAFGWHFVKAMSQGGRALPLWINEDYLRRAYQFERGKNSRDFAIVEAVGLNHPRNYYRKAIFQAALITETPFLALSERLGYEEDTIRAFEQLFFNVRDRKHEHVYIGALTFETGVLVELMPNYLMREAVGTILIRTAARHGLEATLSLAGLTPGRMLSQEVHDNASKIEARIMENALQLADYGLLNQRTPGISNAKGLIQAAKASGQQTKTQELIGVSSLGESLMQEIHDMAPDSIRALTQEKERKLLSEKNKPLDDSNPIIDIIDSGTTIT
jgi:hypothetical protein